jgi:ribonuclease HII
MQASLELEQTLWADGKTRVVGVDEVGRGCLSGPVIVAAVVIPPGVEPLPLVRDSKKLSAKQREQICVALRANYEFKLGAASVKEIDRINILHATLLAMQRALTRLRPYDHALIDGRFPSQPALQPYSTVIKGDQHSYAIACASIIAKVTRDRLMAKLAAHYPGYAWEKNAGYGTKAHLAGMQAHGLTPFHRHSFAPVRALADEIRVQSLPGV